MFCVYDANTLLESEYEIKQEKKKPKPLLPRLKIHNIESENFESKEILVEKILQKNNKIRILKENGNHISVTYYDEIRKYAVLKVTPQIREAVMENSKIFVNMESHYVSDYFHVTQCFACQGFGHVCNSENCPRKGEAPLCMYCSGDHRSSHCHHKKNMAKQKCVNCNKSSNKDIKLNAKSHTSNSLKCPMLAQEIDRIKKITFTDSKNILSPPSVDAV